MKHSKNKSAPNLKQGPLPTRIVDICKALVDPTDLHTNGTLKLVENEESESENINLSQKGKDEEDEEEGWKDIEGYESE